ncbi:MAG: hypothetical protein HY509_00565 [Acidobacteria bacterium]|nr:hypothetical protein [Acidobacteriota bacterium]
MNSRHLFRAWVATAGIAAGAAALAGDKPFFVVPDRPDDPRLRLEAGHWVLPFSGIEIRVRFLDREQCRTFLAERAPDLPDPFAPDGLFPEDHYLFRLDLRNGSAERLTFHPGNVVLITNRNDQELALEYSDFYRRLRDGKDSPEAVLRRWTRVYYDQSHTLMPGESASKLIAFHPPRHPSWKRMKLYISSLQIGSGTHSFSFPFARGPKGGFTPLPYPENDRAGGPS